MAEENALIGGERVAHVVITCHRLDTLYRARKQPLYPARVTFGLEHGDDVLRGIVTEKLAVLAFVIGNTITLNQRNEVSLRVARERRSAKMWIL